ncbi:MAG: ATP-dependent DNA helicase [bacterium]
MKKETNNETFNELYLRLNKEQKKAVDTVEGPLMVIAGPGTGKTSILTLRIVNILKVTDTAPENILALTFTESGAYAMRKKLVSIIGASAYKVNIKTFHGFCNGIIAEFPERFPRIIGSVSISDVDQIKIMEDIISEAKLEYLKPWSDQFYYVRSSLGEIRNLKREAVSAEDFFALIKKQEKDFSQIPDQYHEKGAHKGKMKGEYIKLKEHIAKNKELAGLYKEYEEKLLALKYYDYEDMIVEVVKALRKDPEFLLILQETYQYILADEHQDANNAQNAVLELLSNFHESPNLFIVGDEKQAIFRFQGASLENFLYFKKLYPKALSIHLQSNYRSTQTILDASHSLIENNKVGEGIERVRLSSGVKESKGTFSGERPVDIYEFSNAELEKSFLAREIKKMISEGVEPDEVAVLYRNNKDAFDISKALSREGIVHRIESDKDILKDEHIRKLILIFKALGDLSNAPALSEALFIDFLGLKTLDVFKIISASSKERMNVYDAIRSEEFLQNIKVSLPKDVLALSLKIDKWARMAKNKVFLELFETVVRESGFLNDAISDSNSLSRLSVLDAFFSEVGKTAESKKEYYLTQFIDYLKLIENHGLLIKANGSSKAERGVRLMTAHRSKGLEFEYVFITGAVNGKWGGQSNRQMFHLPKITVDGEGDTNSAETDKLEDERRLFYVAITRAKKHVIITFAKENTSGKEELQTEFIEEIDSKLINRISPEIVEEIEKEINSKVGNRYSEVKETGATITDVEYIKELFFDQGLSITALNNYLECAWKYFFVNLIRLPQAKNKHMLYGTAVHETLRTFFNKYRENIDMSKDEFLKIFEHNLGKEPLSPKDYKEALEKGKISLGGYYDTYMGTWNRNLITEYAVNGVHLPIDGANILLKGKLDRVEFITENLVNVADYKTGKPKSRNEMEGKTKSDDGVKYMRQLVFYKLLLELDEKKRFTMQSGEIDFIEPNERGNYKKERFDIMDSAVEELKGVVAEVAKKIATADFKSNGCGDSECEYCALARLL